MNIKDLIDNYKSFQEEERKARRKGKGGTNEFFTPSEIVIKMMDKIEPEIWVDPNKTWLEPCCGSGNFIIGILYRRIKEYNIGWKQALKTLYALDLVDKNVAECKARVCGMLSQLCEDFDEEEAREVMDKNLVCHDFFTWDFVNWKPLEIQEKKKKR